MKQLYDHNLAYNKIILPVYSSMCSYTMAKYGAVCVRI